MAMDMDMACTSSSNSNTLHTVARGWGVCVRAHGDAGTVCYCLHVGCRERDTGPVETRNINIVFTLYEYVLQ